MRSTLRAESGAREITQAQRDEPLFVQSVARAMQVLSAFHEDSRPLSLSEIAVRAGIDRSGVQRIVHTLRAMGYLRRAPEGRGFLPGVRLLDHTLDFLRLDPLTRRATPVLLELRRNVRERVDLSLLDDLRVVYAARMQSKRETFYATLVGHSVPVFCSSGGWAILARLDDTEARDIVSRSRLEGFTTQTLTDPGASLAAVETTRHAGYALALEQILTGEIALGAAVTDAAGRPVAAIHVAGSLSEWTPEEFAARFAPLVTEAAQAISLQ